VTTHHPIYSSIGLHAARSTLCFSKILAPLPFHWKTWRPMSSMNTSPDCSRDLDAGTCTKARHTEHSLKSRCNRRSIWSIISAASGDINFRFLTVFVCLFFVCTIPHEVWMSFYYILHGIICVHMNTSVDSQLLPLALYPFSFSLYLPWHNTWTTLLSYYSIVTRSIISALKRAKRTAFRTMARLYFL